LTFETPGKLADVLAEVSRFEAIPEQPISEGRITLLRNFTIEGIEPYLKLQLYQSAIRPVVRFGGYDTVVQDLFKIKSGEVAAPDVLVLALVLENLDPAYNRMGWSADLALEKIAAIGEMALAIDSLIAVNTFLPPLYPDSPLDACTNAESIHCQVQRVNAALRAFVAQHPGKFFLCDVERYLRRTGESGIDPRYWYLSQAPFKPEFLAFWAVDLVNILRVLKGKNKKCLVLDCDNTLWGGILGEDGLDGIKLDPFDYPGKVFSDFQAAVTRLSAQGVMVALCSKNNEADVLEVLDQHPHCLLKRAHLVGWKINWQDKATNILALSNELNIGLDAMVFVDDNPAECALIREQLPEVTVLSVPQRLSDYPSLVSRQQLFVSLTVSPEDRMRTTLYQQEQARLDAQKRSVDLEGYLASLQMIAKIHEVTPEEVPRVAQLTQKTNQFNLTTRRYSEADIKRFGADPDHLVFSLSASDRFGDLGLVGVLIVRRDFDDVIVDSCLMSCRALGRGLETTFISAVVEIVRDRWLNVASWRAEYVPTAKNQQVADFWDKWGFERIAVNPDGCHYSRQNDGPWVDEPVYITLLE